MGSVPHQQEQAAAASQVAASPMGRYGPQVGVTRFDTAPRELEWQLPLEGELYRLIPGPDRPDYSLLVLERPLHFYPAPGFDVGRVEAEQRVEDRKGRPMVRVHALLVCARFVGQQLHPGMQDLPVNIAYVIDNSLARDEVVDFAKIEVAAVGFLSEGHSGRRRPTAATPTRPRPRTTPWTTSSPTSWPRRRACSVTVSQPTAGIRSSGSPRPSSSGVTTASPGCRATPTGRPRCRPPRRSSSSTRSSPDSGGYSQDAGAGESQSSTDELHRAGGRRGDDAPLHGARRGRVRRPRARPRRLRVTPA